MTDFTALIDLASERLGGAVIAANDEFFGSRDSLVKVSDPVFVPGKYTDQGKWMDGWETRRRREPGHDWCIVRLGVRGRVHGVVVDTSHFIGNYPEACRIEACRMEGSPDLPSLMGPGAAWQEIVATSPLEGNATNRFATPARECVTHLRLSIFPDGGVARLRVFGRAEPDWARLLLEQRIVDLAGVEHGGLVLACSDMFFGSRHNLIMPGAPAGMADGWETRRRRGPGHDWAVVALGRPGRLQAVEVDTSHFKGNAPGACSVDAGDDGAAAPGYDGWREVLPSTRLQPHTRHRFELTPVSLEATHVRLNIYPDGGVGRFRVWGTVA